MPLPSLRAIGRWLSALAFGALVSGCGGGGGGGNSAVVAGTADAASLPLAATAKSPPSAQDRSCSYEHVYLTVVGLQLLSTGRGEAWQDAELSAPQRVDLMNLEHGLLDALGAAPLPPGKYTQVRLLLAAEPMANAVQPSGGTLMPLSVPGGAQISLSLAGSLDVPSWRSGDIVLDGFDACASLVKTGNSGAYLLRPGMQARVVLRSDGQEHRLGGDQVVALPGGGFATLKPGAAGITVQRHTADGSFAGNAVRIAFDAEQLTHWNALTPLVGGGFVLTWFRDHPDGPRPPLLPYRLMVQTYNAKGAPQGIPHEAGWAYPFAISHTYPATLPTTAALRDGGFVTVWREGAHYMQRYGADGRPMGTAATLGADYRGRVVALASGGFMTAWGLSSISAVTHGPDGSPLGPAQFVGSTLWNPQSSWTDFAMSGLATSGGVVAWTTEVSPSNATPTLYVRRLAADASPIGPPINVGISSIVNPPSVSGMEDGGFVLSWLSEGHVHAMRFAADGSPTSAVARLDTFTTSPADVSVVATGSGGFLVTWSGVGVNGQRARYGRLFGASGLNS